MAVKRYHQALFTHEASKAKPAQFDYKVMRSKQFRKFAVKAIRLQDSYINGTSTHPPQNVPPVVVRHISAASASSASNGNDGAGRWLEGTLLLCYDGAYLRSGNMWEQLSGITVARHLPSHIRTTSVMDRLVLNRELLRINMERQCSGMEVLLSASRYATLRKYLTCVQLLLNNLSEQPPQVVTEDFESPVSPSRPTFTIRGS